MLHEFNLYIYPRRLWITYDATVDELNKEFPSGDTENKPFTDLKFWNNAVTDHVLNKEQKGGILIRFNSKEAMTPEVVAHEAFHAASEVFIYIGEDSIQFNNEPFAYLLSYIVKCCSIVKEN